MCYFAQNGNLAENFGPTAGALRHDVHQTRYSVRAVSLPGCVPLLIIGSLALLESLDDQTVDAELDGMPIFDDAFQAAGSFVRQSRNKISVP